MYILSHISLFHIITCYFLRSSLTLSYHLRCQGIVVITVNRLHAGQPRNRGAFAGRVKGYFCFHSIQNGSGPTLGRFPAAVNRLWCEAGHSHPSSAKTRNGWMCISISSMPDISCTCAVVGTVLEKKYTLRFVFLQILVDCIEPNIFGVDLGMEICNVETDGQNLPTIHYYFFVSKNSRMDEDVEDDYS